MPREKRRELRRERRDAERRITEESGGAQVNRALADFPDVPERDPDETAEGSIESASGDLEVLGKDKEDELDHADEQPEQATEHRESDQLTVEEPGEGEGEQLPEPAGDLEDLAKQLAKSLTGVDQEPSPTATGNLAPPPPGVNATPEDI